MDRWSLPGGYIEKDENLDEAAIRLLTERTGLTNLFLKQFTTFGNASRAWENPANVQHYIGLPDIEMSKIKWLMQRFVSVGYYAITEFSRINPTPSVFEIECRWFPIKKLPLFILDHKKMVDEALKKLQLDIHHEPIGYNLLPEKFTLPELQALYETILRKKLDQRNFTKKLMSLGVLKKLNEKKHIGGHRAPVLYKFNKSNYNKALKEGIELAF
jgi:ADP-ribose pyrophosphatase YjhB (NUDIX family)